VKFSNVKFLTPNEIRSGDDKVEVIATVVRDMKVKKKKNKNKNKKKKKKNKKKSKSKSKRLARKHVVVASIEAQEVLENSKIDISTDETKAAKQKVFEATKTAGVQINLISNPEAIETLLQKEAKTTSTAFYLVNLGTVVDKYSLWMKHLPRAIPHYAVKSNPDINIVRALAQLGCGFDCASKSEIEEVLSIGVTPDRIIFANPCKGPDHIKYAKDNGVDMMTFDNREEIEKIHQLFPNARMVLRILTDDSHSSSPLGTKFGAPPDDCPKLMALCKEKNINLVGISFHVGSGCYSTAAYQDALKLARKMFDLASDYGYKLKLLDIGGGWPGVETGPVSFAEIATDIRPTIDELFPKEVDVISEPGRYFCTASYTLAVNVIGRRERYINISNTTTMKAVDQASDEDSDLELESFDDESDYDADEKLAKNEQALSLDKIEEKLRAKKEKKYTQALSPKISVEKVKAPEPVQEKPQKEILYYLSDGIYGSFNNIIFDHAVPQPLKLATTEIENGTQIDESKTTNKSRLFGPTCDSIDVICKDIELPDLHVGDWLYFMNMGAYTVASSTKFNGFTPPNARYIMTLE
jgi:ornithine decarboxylase